VSVTLSRERSLRQKFRASLGTNLGQNTTKPGLFHTSALRARQVKSIFKII